MAARNTGRKVELYKLGSASVSIGALRFQILHRIVIVDGYEDHGASIDVYGPVGGQDTELIKFDCFEKGPHYHAPARADQTDLDRAKLGNGREWVYSVIRDGLPELLASSGYAELSRTLDRELLAKRWTEVRDAVLQTQPATYAVPPDAVPIVAWV